MDRGQTRAAAPLALVLLGRVHACLCSRTSHSLAQGTKIYSGSGWQRIGGGD